MIEKIAWRNIWRHPARSAVVMMAIVFGLGSSLLLIGYFNGMATQRIRSVIANEVSHIQIHNKEYLKDYDVRYTIPDGPRKLAAISKMPSVKAVTGRMIARGMIANASGSSGVQINGIDPGKELLVTNKKRLIISGAYFLPAKHNEMLVGEKLAKKLKLKLRSKVIISFQDKNNDIASGAFRIAGIYRTTSTPYDEMNVFVDIRDLNALNQSTDSFTEIAMLLQSDDMVPQVQSVLFAKYKGLDIENWSEILPEMGMIVSVMSTTITIFLAVILLGLGFGIVNTMMMAILERRQELGMLISLGMNKRKVFTMVMLETVFLVFIASPVGVLLGWLGVLYLHHTGMNLSRYGEALRSFGYDQIVYPLITMDDLVRITIMVTITAFLSSIFPARMALRLSPAEAIKR
jgi:ABC-type lipoprotein release transport system permease subunit